MPDINHENVLKGQKLSCMEYLILNINETYPTIITSEIKII